MKELTIEEKAKRYDEAIEKLRGMMPNWERLSYNGKTFLQDLTYIFPELKESEDERMVKFIKKQLFNIKKTITENYELDAKLTKAIDWLEKQGEQIYPINTTIKDKIRIYITNHFTTDTVVKTDVNSIVKAMEEGVMIGMSEQKPAEWSEEDEKYTNIVVSALSSPYLERLYHYNKVKSNDIINWLKSLKDRVQSQPQPQWKPSEKQMAALKESVDEHFDIDGGALWHLYEDLKKLKEE